MAERPAQASERPRPVHLLHRVGGLLGERTWGGEDCEQGEAAGRERAHVAHSIVWWPTRAAAMLSRHRARDLDRRHERGRGQAAQPVRTGREYTELRKVKGKWMNPREHR